MLVVRASLCWVPIASLASFSKKKYTRSAAGSLLIHSWCCGGSTTRAGPPRRGRPVRRCAALGSRSSPELQRGTAVPIRPDGRRCYRRKSPTCAHSAGCGSVFRAVPPPQVRSAELPVRGRAAGRHRHRRAVGDGSAGLPPSPGPGGPFPHQLPFCGAGEDLRPAEGHGLRSAVRGAPSGGIAALLPARPRRGAPPGSARLITALRGGGGGVGVEGGVWAGLPDGGRGALLPAEHRGCFCQERGGVRQNGNCFNKGREGEALKAGWWDYFRINPAPEEHLTSSSGDARWGLAVLGQSVLGDTGV